MKVHECPSKDFRDLEPAAWYHEAVDYALSNGLMNGVGGHKFDPNGTATRAMIATIIWRLEGVPVVNAVNPFDDVAAGAWYTDAIIWAADSGIIEGCGDGTFRPNDDITREQLASMLYRYAKYKGSAESPDANILDFDDASDVSSWAVQLKLIQGRTPSTIVPQGKATRAEVAAILMRYTRA